VIKRCRLIVYCVGLDSTRLDSARLGLIRVGFAFVRLDSTRRNISKRWPITRADLRSRDRARRELALAVYEASDADRASVLFSLFSRPFINKPLHLVPFRFTATRVAPSSCVRKRVPPLSLGQFPNIAHSRLRRRMLRCWRTASCGSCCGTLRSEEDREAWHRSWDKKTFEKKIAFSRISNEVRRICVNVIL